MEGALQSYESDSHRSAVESSSIEHSVRTAVGDIRNALFDEDHGAITLLTLCKVVAKCAQEANIDQSAIVA